MKTKILFSILTLAVSMQASAATLEGTARVHSRAVVPRNCSMQLQAGDGLLGQVSAVNSTETGSVTAAVKAQNSEVLLNFADLREKSSESNGGVKEIKLDIACNSDFSISMQSLNGGLQNARAEDGSKIRANIPYTIQLDEELKRLVSASSILTGGQALVDISSKDIEDNALSGSVNLSEAQNSGSSLMKGGALGHGGTNSVVNGTAIFSVAINTITSPSQPDYPQGEYIDTLTIQMSQP